MDETSLSEKEKEEKEKEEKEKEEKEKEEKEKKELKRFLKYDLGYELGYLRSMRFDEDPDTFRWVFVQQTKSVLDQRVRDIVDHFQRCVRCSKKVEPPYKIAYNNPYCPECREWTIEEERDWVKQMRAYDAAKKREEMERNGYFDSRNAKTQTPAVPQTWEEASRQDRALELQKLNEKRERQKKREKEKALAKIMTINNSKKPLEKFIKKVESDDTNDK